MGGFPFFDKTKRAGRCLLGHTILAKQRMEDVIMATITKDTIVGDILDIAPETAPAFIDIGMHCLGCPASRNESCGAGLPGPRPARGRAGGKAQRDHRGKPEVKPKKRERVPLPFFVEGKWNETIELSPRLAAIAEQVPQGARLADVGPTMPIRLLGSCWRGAFQGRWPRTCGRAPPAGRETARLYKVEDRMVFPLL